MKNHDHNIELNTTAKKNNKSPKHSIILYYCDKNLIKKVKEEKGKRERK